MAPVTGGLFVICRIGRTTCWRSIGESSIETNRTIFGTCRDVFGRRMVSSSIKLESGGAKTSLSTVVRAAVHLLSN